MKYFAVIFLVLILAVTSMMGADNTLFVFGDSFTWEGSGTDVVWTAAVFDTNLIGHYEFSVESELADGWYRDSSGWGNVGTQSTASARAAFATNALDFDGGDFVEFPNTIFAIGTNDFSFGAWFSTTTASLSGILTRSKNAGADGRWFLLINVNAGKVYAGFDAASTYVVESSTIVTNGAWYHAMATIDRDGNMLLYINGIEEASADASGSDGNDYSTNMITRIGASGNTGGEGPLLYFNGYIDEPRIYMDARTSNEVYTLYTDGR